MDLADAIDLKLSARGRAFMESRFFGRSTILGYVRSILVLGWRNSRQLLYSRVPLLHMGEVRKW